MLCSYPHLFLEKICCLAVIMGEFGDSGRSQAFDVMAKRWEM